MLEKLKNKMKNIMLPLQPSWGLGQRAEPYVERDSLLVVVFFLFFHMLLPFSPILPLTR